MDFRLTPEQDGFAQSLGELMAKADSVAAARAWAAGDAEPGLALWRRLAEQGVNALVVPEEQGGLGGTAMDLVVAFEVLGHHLAVGPWIESAAYLARSLDGDDLAAVAEGAVATVAVPPLVPYALDADVASHVFVPTNGGFETLAGARSSTTGDAAVRGHDAATLHQSLTTGDHRVVEQRAKRVDRRDHTPTPSTSPSSPAPPSCSGAGSGCWRTRWTT